MEAPPFPTLVDVPPGFVFPASTLIPPFPTATEDDSYIESYISTIGLILKSAPLLSSAASDGEKNDTKARFYSSFLSSDRCRAQLNWKREPFFGKCYQSTSSTSAQRFEYKPLEQQIKNLIVSRSYTDKEVFLREVINDALDKLQLLCMSEPEMLENNAGFLIRIKTDQDNGIITITDTGICMTREELINWLGTISQSRTANFMKDIQAMHPSLVH